MNESGNSKKWLEIHDAEVTAESLMAQIEERVKRRRQELGRIDPQFPTFGRVTEMPEPASPQDAPNLYHHLRQLNRREPPDVTAVLLPSPATRLPIIGRLWGLIRGQFHNLILFYVNRAQAYNSQTYHNLTNTLNELTRLTQEQKRAIEALERELYVVRKQKGDA